jgi:glutathione S-transferase
MKLVIGNKNYSSWSLRGWLATKASGHAFEEIRIGLRQPDTKAQILQWSPSGKIPCLIDNGLVVWDSLAIAEYLAEEVTTLWPLDGVARAVARAVSAEMHSGFAALRQQMSMDICGQNLQAERTPELETDIRRIERIWTDCRCHYGNNGPYLFGEYCVADMMFAPICFRFNSYNVELEGIAMDYLQTMRTHPHMLEWQAGAVAESAPAEDFADQ